MNILPGDIASIFEYQDTVNFGSYGTVLKVTKKSTINLGNQKYYAMKVVFSGPEDSNSLMTAENELKILKELNNPYFVNIDSFFKVEDKFYLAIDYCPNRDLLKAVADKKTENQDFNENEIWKYFIQTSYGLEALHTKGFIHRDIKLKNILLDENNNVKLDSGLSKHLKASSVEENPPFYSPRMCNGDYPAKESDIWALGCVLYYLCNLEDPFQGNKEKLQNEPHMPIKSQYSEELRYFVDWCLKKKRNERPTIIEIITHEFIANKAISLGLAIPTRSAMNAAFQVLFNSEKEKNLKIESKLLELNNESIKQKAEIEHLRAENASLKNIIAANGNDIEAYRLKAVEIAKLLEKKKILNEKQLVEVKNSIRALIADAEKIKKMFDYSEQDLNSKEPEIAQNQNMNIVARQDLRHNRSEVLNSSKTSELEEEFRKTCSTIENDSSVHYLSATQPDQGHANTYHQKAYLFNVSDKGKKTNLLIYNPETGKKGSKILNTSQPLDGFTCITQIPNNKLFCFGKTRPSSGITLTIDVENYKVEELPSGPDCKHSSAIYFNNNVYCFGGFHNSDALTLSIIFDFGRNQWNELTPLPIACADCNSIIFNENILISAASSKNLWRYSIHSNSFATIPYDFAADKRKILISTDRLYLIECNKGSIYESEIASDIAWRQITNNSTIDFLCSQSYWLYKNGNIYIGAIKGGHPNNRHACFKFDLNEKRLTKMLDYQIF